MNVGTLSFLAIAGMLIIGLPRRFAAIPLLLAAAYTARNPIVEIGPANLSVLRLLVLAGMFRAVARGERLGNGINVVDVLLILWAALLVGVSLLHTSDAWTFRLGLVLGELGVYFLCRVFIQDAEDVGRVFTILCLTLAPLAALMLLEKYTAHNYFGIMGTGGVIIRDGHVRAYGPFGHPILAGTVGATCVPMAIAIWRKHRVIALIGLWAGTGIVLASTSSGPVMMVLFTAGALLLWKVRHWVPFIRWGTIPALIALQLVMNDPVYFLMARIDITGSSTGWFRAQLIRSSIEHLGEWWAVGTDYTRHWMASGIYANQTHTDITNHLLAMGVMGGLPLLTLFVLTLITAFRAVGSALRHTDDQAADRQVLIWTLGAMLFGQVVNFWSISLFDQSVSFFYLVLASIGAIRLPAGMVAVASSSSREVQATPDRRALAVTIVVRRRAAVVTAGRSARIPQHARRAPV